MSAGAFLMAGTIVVLAWTSPLRAYTRRHHSERFVDHGAPHAAIPAPPRDEPADVRAALDGLRPNDVVAGFMVTSIEPPDAGELHIVFRRVDGASSMSVTLTRPGFRPGAPPRHTDRYAIYYDHEQGITSTERDTLLSEIERRIRSRETGTPVPSGL